MAPTIPTSKSATASGSGVAKKRPSTQAENKVQKAVKRQAIQKKKDELQKRLTDLQARRLAVSEDPINDEDAMVIDSEMKSLQDQLTELDKEDDVIMRDRHGNDTQEQDPDTNTGGMTDASEQTTMEAQSDDVIASVEGDTDGNIVTTHASSETEVGADGFVNLVAPDDQTDGSFVDGEVIGYRPGGRGSTMVVVKNGPRNAPIYKEIPAAQAPASFSKEHSVCLTDERVGEKKSHGVYEYRREHCKMLQGVAIAYPNDEKSPEKFLHPASKGKRYPAGSYAILWQKDGQQFRTWETRTTFRRVWPGDNKVADMAIYNAFTIAMKRYQEVVDGTRNPEDRSPTADPALKAPVVSPSATPEPSSQSTSESSTAKPSGTLPSPSPTPSPSNPQVDRQPAPSSLTSSSTPVSASDDNEKKLKKEFIDTMKEALEIEGPLNSEQAMDIAARWTMQRRRIMAG